MIFTKILAKIKGTVEEKKTKKLLKQYEKALFPKESPEKYQKVSYKNIFTFTKYAEIPEDKPFAILLFCTSDCYGERALTDVMTYVKKDVQVMVLADAESFPLLPKKHLREISRKPSNGIYITHNTFGIKGVLERIVGEIAAPVVFMASGNTGITKNLLFDIASIPVNHHDVCVPGNPCVFCKDAEDDFSFACLSGAFIRREALVRAVAVLPEDARFWVGRSLLPDGTYAGYSVPIIQKFAVRKYIFELFGHLVHHADTGPEVIEKLLPLLHTFVTQRDISKLHTFFLGVTFAYLLFKYDLNDEKLKERISNEFNFGILLDAKRIWKLMKLFAPILARHLDRKYDALVIENYGMDDIYKSQFYKRIEEEYNIKYLKKRTEFNYYSFNNLVLRIYAIASKMVITSGSLNKNMVGKDSNLLTLWHGLGLLKETVVKPKKFTVGTIVCSSEGCEKYYKKHFHAKRAVGLGGIQTDDLRNPDYVAFWRSTIRAHYKLQDERLAFFAPTFRLGGVQHYDLMMDVEELSEKLAAAGIKVLAKKHYVFDHVLKKTHMDTSGLRTSGNGVFEVDTEHSFTELVCACDVFVTDYSSGIFYAAVLDKPLVLYAPDVEEYERGDNGFIIRYPEDIPATAVLEPDADLLVRALQNPSDPSSEEYRKFKELHVGACDGSVNERVLRYFSERLEAGDAARQ